MDSITTDILIEEVVNEMPAYFETNKVDRSVLLPKLKKCVRQLGVGRLSSNVEFVHVKNYKAKLPNDFYLLTSATACWTRTRIEPIGTPYENQIEICEKPVCPTFQIEEDQCGRMYKIVQNLPYESWSWEEFELLGIEKTSINYCAKNYLKSQSPNTVFIRDKHLHTNFEEALIMLEYVVNPETADGWEVPGHPTITEWLKAEMKVAIFEYLYDNMEPNIEQRLGNARQRAGILELQARSLNKLSEINEFYDLRNILSRRYTSRAKEIWKR